MTCFDVVVVLLTSMVFVDVVRNISADYGDDGPLPNNLPPRHYFPTFQLVHHLSSISLPGGGVKLGEAPDYLES